MSFPNVIFGDYGDEKTAAASAIGGLPLGQLMMLPDGRKFRHAQCSTATAVTAGVLVAASAGQVGHGNVSGSGLLASATTTENLAGHTAVYLISKSTAVTKDQYANGYLNIQGPAASSYIGRVHKIKGNASAAVSTRFKIDLYPTDPLQVALKAGTTSCSLRYAEYKELITMSSSAIVGGPIGVTPTAVSASFYFWLQRSGPASVIQAAAGVTDGNPVQASSVTSGSVTVMGAGSAITNVFDAVPIGTALEGAAASTGVLVNLEFE